jgi:hypothetical protein
MKQGYLGQVNLSLYDIAKGESSASPNFSMKIEVENLSQVMSKLAKLDKVEVVMDQESLPDGKMSIVLDPEGYSIELSEPWKET